MANPVLEQPPGSWPDDHVFRPGDLGSDVKIVFCNGRGSGISGRSVRSVLAGAIFHIMGDSARTPQGFASSMEPADSTLSECSFYDASCSPWGKPTMLQALPVNRIGAGSVAGCATGLTCETSPAVGQDANGTPWTEGMIEMMARFYAFLVKNPRRWPKVDVRPQLYQDPYAPTGALGGFGFHTFWGDVSNTQGGTSPWTLSIRTCPGYVRRGYRPTTPHYELKLSDNLPGNVRALFNRALSKLATDPLPTPGDDMVLIKGNSPSNGGTAGANFPYKGNGTAQWMPAVLPRGYVLVHVDDGNFATVMGAAGELRVVEQVTVDAANKATAQEYRDFLKACSSGGSGDTSQLATKTDVAAVGTKVDGVNAKVDVVSTKIDGVPNATAQAVKADPPPVDVDEQELASAIVEAFPPFPAYEIPSVPGKATPLTVT